MGIQLDWEIEAGRGGQRRFEEDPKERKQRGRAAIRLLLVLAVFGGVIALGLFLFTQRLEQVDSRIEGLLRDTVNAEVAALRIGDLVTFKTLQRSATLDWLNSQVQVYEQVQTAKAERNLSLTGRIVDVAIEGQRARVQVEEIEDGVPYVQTWFYWYYREAFSTQGDPLPAGWFHVPPDYTFWGEPQERVESRLRLRYGAVDEPFAQALNEQLNTWLAFACGVLECSGVPFPITLDVVASPLEASRWQVGEAWQLVIPSPYVGRARLDAPLSGALQLDIATQMATRLVNTLSAGAQQAQAYSDAYYLRQALTAWLVGRFIQQDAGAYLLESLYQQYGGQAIAQVAQRLQANDSIAMLAGVLNVPDLSQVALDWRDFFTWRLNSEAQALAEGNQTAFVGFYAYERPEVQAIVIQRYNGGSSSVTYQALAVVPDASTGTPRLQVTAQVTRGELVTQEIIVFALQAGTWLRVS